MLIRNNRKALVAIFVPGNVPGTQRIALEPGSVTAIPDEISDEILEHFGNERLFSCGWLEILDESHGRRVLVRNTRGHKVRLGVPLVADDCTSSKYFGQVRRFAKRQTPDWLDTCPGTGPFGPTCQNA